MNDVEEFIRDLPSEIIDKLPIDYKSYDPKIVIIAISLMLICKCIEKIVNDVTTKHRRKTLLSVYRLRHKWRKADMPLLYRLGVNDAAQRRLQRLERLEGHKSAGRGVIRYRPFNEIAENFSEAVRDFFEPTTSPHRRIALLKRTPFWPYVIEALYRGEYSTLKVCGVASPSETAERMIAERVGVSAASVRKHCTAVRQKRKQSQIEVMNLADFNNWSMTGDIGFFIQNRRENAMQTIAVEYSSSLETQ